MKTQDFLVIGSGLAGLTFALRVAELGRVTVLCKEDPSEGNTNYAQGGIASVTSPTDSFDSHMRDTLIAGAGLCHQDAVELAVREGPECILRLVELGANFDRDASHAFDLAQEGGHSARRILHVRDATGAEIQRTLFSRAAAHPAIEILPFHIAIDLIVSENEVQGVYALNRRTGEITAFSSNITMLASGGAGKVYLYTSNPNVATGDGIAMAYRAGAAIANMEFIQFHPTCLYHPQMTSFLITEALRGEGARLIDSAGQRFMDSYDPREELAPRDIVARAIDDQMKKTGEQCVFLDISHREPEFVRSRFPTIYTRLKEIGLDMTTSPVPVVPAAHYLCGGVQSDLWGRTTLEQLYVAGEAACTGLHGANRLASNSLLEALVFAARAAEHVRQHYVSRPPPIVQEWDDLDTTHSSEAVIVTHMWEEVRRLMWNLVGIVRSDHRLALARRRIALIKREVRDYYWRNAVAPDLIELRNIVDVAELIIVSAAARRESRGLHYNVDCPERDDVSWLRDTVLTRAVVESTEPAAQALAPD